MRQLQRRPKGSRSQASDKKLATKGERYTVRIKGCGQRDQVVSPSRLT